MQDLNELKLSINKLINNIDEEKRLKKELEEKENNYSKCINEISKLEDQINKLSGDIYNIIKNIQDNYGIFMMLTGMLGFTYPVFDIIIKRSFSITSLIPIAISLSGFTICCIIRTKVINKILNSTEYKEMQKEKKEKEINLANKKIERKTLSEEITKLKSQLGTNNYNTNEIIDTLNVTLKNENQITSPLEEIHTEENKKAKVRTLK